MGMGTRLAVNNALEFSSLAFAAGKAFFLAVALSLVFMAQVNIIYSTELLEGGSTGCGVSALPHLER